VSERELGAPEEKSHNAEAVAGHPPARRRGLGRAGRVRQ
jgi:hypothetical protein